MTVTRESASSGLGLLGAGGLALLWACSGYETLAPDGSNQVASSSAAQEFYETGALLADVGQLALTTARRFADSTAELERATAAYAEGLSLAERDAAGTAWQEAMSVWQVAELLRFGPAGDASTPGGLGLGDEIYSYAVSVNTCRVDVQTAATDHADADALSTKAITTRGLDALEYLLFNESDENTCFPGARLNRTGEWDALGATIVSRRAAQAAAVASDVRRLADALVEAWDPAQGNFLGSLSTGTAPFAGTQDALSAVVGATLYLDTQTKDRKLADPAGFLGCAQASCPDRRESLFAQVSKQNIRQNLVGFQQLLVGTDGGLGLRDELDSVGASELSVALQSDVEVALSAVDALGEATLGEALSEDSEGVLSLFDSIKAVTDRIKGELVDELGLTLTQPGAGDAD